MKVSAKRMGHVPTNRVRKFVMIKEYPRSVKTNIRGVFFGGGGQELQNLIIHHIKRSSIRAVGQGPRRLDGYNNPKQGSSGLF